MRKIERISISDVDRERLEDLVRDRNTPQKVVWRARIVLGAAAGLKAVEIAACVGKSVLTVRRWRRRYVGKGVDGLLKDATRPPRRKPLTAEKIGQVVDMTLPRSFKVSRDPNFVDKVEDVTGLYFNPPAKALVLSVDEKS